MPINLNVVTAGKLEEFGEQMWTATKTYAQKGVPIVQQNGNATIQPNTLNIWSAIVTNTTITKGTDIAGIANEYIVQFVYAAGTITFDWGGATIAWYGGLAPSFVAGKTYEISIIDNLALWAEFN